MKLYLITGTSGSGKDELGYLLQEELNKLGKKSCLLKVTRPLYEICKNHFGWNGDMDNKPRDLLQTLGIEVIKEKLHKKDYLINNLIEEIEILDLYFDVGIVTDIRLVEEIETLNTKFDTTTILIERVNYLSQLTEKQQKHLTENDFLRYNKYNHKIENTSLDKLREASQVILGGSKNE